MADGWCSDVVISHVVRVFLLTSCTQCSWSEKASTHLNMNGEGITLTFRMKSSTTGSETMLCVLLKKNCGLKDMQFTFLGHCAIEYFRAVVVMINCLCSLLCMNRSPCRMAGQSPFTKFNHCSYRKLCVEWSPSIFVLWISLIFQIRFFFRSIPENSSSLIPMQNIFLFCIWLGLLALAHTKKVILQFLWTKCIVPA